MVNALREFRVQQKRGIANGVGRLRLLQGTHPVEVCVCGRELILDRGGDGLGGFAQGVEEGAVGEGGGGTFVAAFADALDEGDLAQERDAVFIGHVLTAVTPEDVVLVVGQFGRREPRHVLDDAQDGLFHLGLAEHIDALFDIRHGDLLRRGDDDGAAQRNVVDQRDVDVTGPRRQVDQEIVELAPLDLQEHLFRAR